ncbi:hypothetical protein MBANPS3_006815 [Mucor bainieri]
MVNATDNITLWKSRLQNLTDLQVPTDYPRPLPARTVEEVQTFDLSEQTLLSLAQFSMIPSRPTPFSVILAAFSVLLQRYTGDEEFAIGTSSPTGNPLLLRLNIDPASTLSSIIQMVTEVEQEALEQEVPFDQLYEAMYKDTDPDSRRPLCRVRFYNEIDTPSQHHLASSSASSDLTVFISSPEQSSSLRTSFLRPVSIRVVYNQILFSPRRIEYLFSQLATLIETGAKSQELAVGQIPLSDSGSEGSPLPDPTSDLHWSQWRGAITDIFSANANKHPERTCIVESLDESDATVTYNYQQIHHASNTVAHYLVANGIQREDVVMIYAYRGVDLVIAIMGVLKAGATFSVIDPAYPPARQEIYLSVAKPKGLIVLQEAGKIADSVREYIKKEQAIVCEIPNLKIGRDGHLSGGVSEGGADLLDSVRGKASQDTGIVIGPDSIGTLSFTSGSTGIPKGVRGRHFSLTHFYPWMAETFGISSQDKFTMLSGIAHDPIQRDIFTPLFLGSELHIPTSEDIGIPGRLAEWMNKSQVTVTHLTPAMGQLLSSHAQVEIPSLINAFFVGDILTKRDAARIQKYAPNVAVINMYGTTETQRSVSHFIVPARSSHPAFLSSQKEVIAAGKGMVNVQLLVVNRHDRTKMCGVGEIGEIYVRAPGLAEGYLQLPEATAEKFIPNWFVANPCQDDGVDESCVEGDAWKQFYLGKRDRMYRSGDLGRYRPDGNVECTGRADDQVKIRGFRIELGEIDTHLSQHPCIRENVTLVRRDKNEEQTLVAYFVPNLAGSDGDFASATEGEGDYDENDVRSNHHFRRLIKHIRDYLKQKLPSYAIPAVFVPLVRMPLTPNGKVDKNALPFPDTAQFNKNAAAPEAAGNTELPPMSQNEAAIHAIWKDLLPSSDPVIGLTENFFDIGGHSLIATRLIFEIRQKFQVDAPLGLVFAEPTIAGLAREVNKLQNGDLLLENNMDQQPEEKKEVVDYAADLESLANEFLAESYGPLATPAAEGRTFVLTGGTGFLGAFILDKLLSYKDTKKVICVVRAKDNAAAFKRVKQASIDHLLWNDAWESRIEAICGDLGSDRLGLSEQDWSRCASGADAVVHNGALVHWVYPYHQLRAPNVVGTLWAMRLATEQRQKSFHFVSSTSVLDTPAFLETGAPVSEDNNLEDGRTGLENGYGQSKWVAEKLILEARSRGMPATIIRPGYILGDSRSGVTNTDDFIWRLLKGCVELGYLPAMSNDINCCAVDYVASVVAGAAYHDQESTKLGVLQVTHPAGFTYNEMFGSLLTYGYQCQQTEYIDWRNKLMEYTLKSQDHSLFPLLHFVLDDLPTSTKSAQLDDTHTQAVLALDGVKQPLMGDELLGLYLAYLIKVGYMPQPSAGYRALPELKAEVTLLKRSGAKH